MLLLTAVLSLSATAPELLPYGKPVRDAYFQFAPGSRYFNHGGYGATPKPVQQAMIKYTDEMELQPTLWFGTYHTYINANRPRLATIVNASEDDLVYLDNASSGMNAVLRSLQWKAGDILFIIGSVYAVFTNVAAWLTAQYGVRVVHVEIAYPVAGEDDYLTPVGAALDALSIADRARVRLALLDHYSS